MDRILDAASFRPGTRDPEPCVTAIAVDEVLLPSQKNPQFEPANRRPCSYYRGVREPVRRVRCLL